MSLTPDSLLQRHEEHAAVAKRQIVIMEFSEILRWVDTLELLRMLPSRELLKCENIKGRVVELSLIHI